MPKLRAVGTLIIRQPYEHDFDPVRGQTTTETFESVGDNLGGYANLYANNRVAYHWRRGARSTIRATFSGAQTGPDAAQDNWQLLNNVIQRSIFKAPFALALGTDVLRAAKAYFNLWSQGDPDEADAVRDEVPTDLQAGFDNLVAKLFNGTTHYDVSQPVLRGSISISNFFTGGLPGEGGMLNIWTTATLLSDFGTIPPYLAQKIGSFVEPALVPGYQFGWLQTSASAVTDAANRISVSKEWSLDQWDTDVYPVL